MPPEPLRHPVRPGETDQRTGELLDRVVGRRPARLLAQPLVPGAAHVPIEAYDEVKVAVQQAFVDAGATLSHHHAVGTEHARWLEEDISAPGVTMLRALFDGVDPGANLNPGKIVGSSRSRV